MTDHNLGPWTVGQSRNVVVSTRAVNDADGVTVCNLGIYASDESGRLIAAAPDMLDALKAALRIVDAHRRVSGGDGDATALLIRTAIAKAIGG